MATVEKLYNLYNVIQQAKERGPKHEAAFKEILNGMKGGVAERRLASQFVTQFYPLFPKQQDAALNAMFDLCEDTEESIRRQTIRSLPSFCKANSDCIPKVSDILAQLLQMEDPAEVNAIQTSLASLLKLDAKATLTGLFYEIKNCGEEIVRQKCLELIQAKIKTLGPDVFTADVEKLIVDESAIVLKDASETDFLLMVAILRELSSYRTASGKLKLVELVAEQCKLNQAINKKDSVAVNRFATCIKQVVPLFSPQIKSKVFVEYLCNQILPALSCVKPNVSLDIIKNFAEMMPYAGGLEDIDKKVAAVYPLLIAQMPLPPPQAVAPSEKVDELESSLPFSRVECLLYIFHSLARHAKPFLEGNPDRLKDFRSRLQYFSRGSQAYQKAIQAALNDKTASTDPDQVALKKVALRMTANINHLIRDLFHQPPSYKAVITLSWKEKAAGSVGVVAAKSSSPMTNGVKRHAPISMDGLAKSKSAKVERPIYRAPRGRRGGRF